MPRATPSVNVALKGSSSKDLSYLKVGVGQDGSWTKNGSFEDKGGGRTLHFCSLMLYWLNRLFRQRG